MTDRPSLQYFCCMPVLNREFLRKHPVATKRWLRACVKAADVCARQPERAVRFLVDRGLTPNYARGLQALKEILYDKWREYDPEDTLRFYGLRLKEAGMINGSPREIIARGTDWRFPNELKRELRSRGAVPGGTHHENHRG